MRTHKYKMLPLRLRMEKDTTEKTILALSTNGRYVLQSTISAGELSSQMLSLSSECCLANATMNELRIVMVL